MLRVVLSLLSARQIGLLLAMVRTALLIVLLIRSVPLRGLEMSILFARRLLLLWPAVLLSVLVGVTSMTRRLLMWPVVLLSALVGVT